jgi:hypothetical protein
VYGCRNCRGRGINRTQGTDRSSLLSVTLLLQKWFEVDDQFYALRFARPSRSRIALRCRSTFRFAFTLSIV